MGRRDLRGPPEAEAGEIAVLGADGLTWHRPADLPAGARADPRLVLVPTEHVLLRSADLPIAGYRQRAAAAPFAIEGDLAEPLPEVHVALGPEVEPRRHILGVVRHDLMLRWAAMLDAAGLAQWRMVPDALLVALPGPGEWSVHKAGERVLVRTADGAGFAVSAAVLPAAWRAAGRPVLLSRGEKLDPDLPCRPADAVAGAGDDAGDTVMRGFDLRQGRYAVGIGRSRRTLVTVVATAIAGLVLHIGILAADVVRLQGIAADRRAEASALLRRVAPAAGPGDDAAAVLLQLLARAGDGGTGRFPTLLATASTALNAHRQGLTIRSLSYGVGAGTMALTVEAGDLAALQRIEASLAAAGLAPSGGAATVGDGGARVRLVLHDQGGREVGGREVGGRDAGGSRR